MKKSATKNYHSKPHKLFKITVFIGFFLSIFHCSAHAWTVSATWDSLPTGGSACDGNAGSGDGLADGCGTLKTVSTNYAHSGSKSMKIHILKGEANTGQPHFAFPDRIYEGGEFWGRFYMYVPAGFDWYAENIVKLFRIVQSYSDGSGAGYVSILTTAPGQYGCGASGDFGYLVGGSEYTSLLGDWGSDGSHICQTHGKGAYLTSGSWHQLELYVKASSSISSGVYRMWHNGTLIWEKTGVRTIPSGGYLGDAPTNWYQNHFMGWWNQGGAVPTKDEDLYVDDFVYTNQRPSNRDTYGNYMIGTGTYVTPSPKQPSFPSTIRISP